MDRLVVSVRVSVLVDMVCGQGFRWLEYRALLDYRRFLEAYLMTRLLGNWWG